jgi:hypothetical protein
MLIWEISIATPVSGMTFHGSTLLFVVALTLNRQEQLARWNEPLSIDLTRSTQSSGWCAGQEV